MVDTIAGRRVGPRVQLHNLVLVLRPSDEVEAALRSYIDLQQDRTSPSFHRWLTPARFGQEYGVAYTDIAAVTAWLQDSGLQVESVSNGSRFITLSGSVDSVERAFRTEIHSFSHDGIDRVGNTSDLSVPSALAPVIRGLARLDNFYRRQSILQGGSVELRSARTTSSTAEAAGPRPEPLAGTGASGPHYVGPGDAARIYNAVPLTSTGIDGNGTTIAVLARSNITLAGVAAFRSIFGLPANAPVITLVGADPGLGSDAPEAFLDTEWAGALAPGATVQLVVGAPTLTADGIDTAALYAVDNNIGDIISLSYGECEADVTASGAAFWNSLWQQAAAQGQTVFVAAGDSGAAGCDASTNATANGSYGVNALGSSAYNVAVGGTMFVDYGPAQFWGAPASAPPHTTALGYMPEAAWNQGRLTTTNLLADSSGTAPGSGIVGTGGGVSIDTARPAWQVGSEVPLYADPPGSAPGGAIGGLHRLVPDVAMLGSFGHDGTLYCGVGMCQSGGSTVSVGVVGGTSISAPAMASAQALINQKNGGRQGNVNYVYYSLSARQSASGISCQSMNGTVANPTVSLPAAACDFHDIVAGSNLVPLSPNNNLSFGFTASSGFDETTGLGSPDIANLANDWPAATFRASSVAFSLSPPTAVHGAGQAFSIVVSPGSGTGTPTGTVVFSGPSGAQFQQLTLAGGSASGVLRTLPAGSYSVSAHYAGDGVFAPGDSLPVAVQIAREPSTLALVPGRVSASGQVTQSSSFVYGDSLLRLDTVASASSGYGTPTGSVAYVLQTSTPLPVLTLPLDASGRASLLSGPPVAVAGFAANYGTLPAGSYIATATYAGDTSFLPSVATAGFSIARATPILQVSTSLTGSIVGGTSVDFTAVIPTQPASTAATGSVQFSDVATGAVLCTATLAAGVATCATSALVTAGTHGISATYGGDTNYTAAGIQLSVTVSGAGTGATVTLAPMTLRYGTTATNLVATVSPLSQGTLAFTVDGAASVPAACLSGPLVVTCTATLPTATLSVGVHTVSAVFTGTSATASATGTLTVTAAVASILLTALEAAYDGTPHAVALLTTPAGLAVDVTYSGSPQPPTAAGTYAVSASVRSANYTGTAAASLHIARAVPVITWPQPGAMPYGTALGALQLNAKATLNGTPVAGAFTWTPTAGAIPDAGSVILQASFQPADTTNFAPATARQSVLVQPVQTALALSASANPGVPGVALTLTAALQTSPAIDNAAIVQFTDGGVPLGSATVQHGTASLTVALAAGTHALAAAYTGSANATPATATLALPVASLASNFTLAAMAGSTVTVAPGADATLPFVVTPSATFVGAVALSCADLPSAVSCSFNVPALAFAAAGGQQGVTVRFTATAQHASLQPGERSGRWAGIAAAVAGMPLLLFGRRRRSVARFAVMLVLCIMAATSGCGVGLTPAATVAGTPSATTYTVRVVASGGGSVQSMPVTLTLRSSQ